MAIKLYYGVYATNEDGTSLRQYRTNEGLTPEGEPYFDPAYMRDQDHNGKTAERAKEDCATNPFWEYVEVLWDDELNKEVKMPLGGVP